MNRLMLIGAGGHGKIAADIAEASGYTDISFLDAAYPKRKSNCVWKIVGSPDDGLSGSHENTDVFISIGSNVARAQFANSQAGINWVILRHPSAIVSPYAKIATGTMLAAGSIINVDAVIGNHVIINTGASIDHDCDLADFVHISPGARLAGGVSIGARSWIGIGAVVREGIKIGADVTVGAGAAVVQDIPDGTTVVGVPARAC